MSFILMGCRAIPMKPRNLKWKSVKDLRLGAVPFGAHDVITANQWVNDHIVYTPDSDGDVWQSPDTTIGRKKGDCEDFCILKRAILIQRGIPEQDIRLVIGYDNILRTNHMIVVVNGELCLDNTTNNAIPATEMAESFLPKFAFSADTEWVFGERDPNYTV